MTYDDPLIVTLNYSAVAFGAATTPKRWRPPANRKTRLLDASIWVTTTFAGTTPAFITVGDPTTAAKLMTSLSMGTTAANNLISKTAIATAIVSTLTAGEVPYVAVNTDVVIALNAAVGGSPAGAADCTFVFGAF